MMGANGFGSMNGMMGMSGGYGNMMGGYGMSGYGGMNMGGYNPYGSMGYGNAGNGNYNPYGSMNSYYPSYNPYTAGTSYGGLSSYNPWASNYSSQYNAGGLGSYYSNQYSNYSAQLRQTQQNAMTSQDVQAASHAVYEAQTRYYSTLGQSNGTNSYTSGYSPYYNSGYSGYYSSSPSTYYGNYGTTNNPPAVNATRQ